MRCLKVFVLCTLGYESTKYLPLILAHIVYAALIATRIASPRPITRHDSAAAYSSIPWTNQQADHKKDRNTDPQHNETATNNSLLENIGHIQFLLAKNTSNNLWVVASQPTFALLYVLW